MTSPTIQTQHEPVAQDGPHSVPETLLPPAVVIPASHSVELQPEAYQKPIQIDEPVAQQSTLDGAEERTSLKRVSSSLRGPSPSEETPLTPLETREAVTEESDPLRDPLRTNFSEEANNTQELPAVVEENDIVNSNGRLLYSDVDTRPVSKRASHLRLDLKPPSPQPWEIIDPPEIDRKGGPDYYSTLGSRKFHTLQSTT